MKMGKLLFIGMLVMGLMVALIGCTGFTGDKLAGTKWATTSSQDMSALGNGLKATVTITATFDETNVTVASEVTKWEGDWPDEGKTKVEGLMKSDDGTFPYTYTKPNGSYTNKGEVNFVVDTEKKTLTVSDDGEDIVLNLQ
jgi:hypothetical protein